ncbi:MAG: outer membrane protein assembly factor BamB family protein, partial [Planctomycetota bacterium]
FDGFHALSGQHTALEGADGIRLIKGPAYGKVELAAANVASDNSGRNLPWAPPVPNASSQDWPTYRHDISRSGAAGTAVSADLNRKWTADLGGKLSGVVVAQNKLLVSAVDRQIIHCLDATSGSELWKFFAAGPVDSPPTVCGEMAIFGCRNGYVYALRASDGELAWRFRAAPVDRRTVVRDRLESVWPVHGSVLVVDGTVYFAAGHTSYLDGGIRLYGLDAATGDIKYTVTHTSEGADKECAIPDVLISDGRTITMRLRRYDLSLNEIKGRSSTTIVASTGLLEDCWGHRWKWDWNLGGSDTVGRLLTFNGETAYGVQAYYTFLKHDRSMWPETHSGHLHQKYSRYSPGQFPTGTRLFAQDNVKKATQTTKRPKRALTANRHKWNRKTSMQYRTMMLAGELLFAAGWKDSEKIFTEDPDSENDSVLEAISAADGKTLRQYPLEAEPVFDGMAAAYGRLYLPLKNGKILCMAGKR